MEVLVFFHTGIPTVRAVLEAELDRKLRELVSSNTWKTQETLNRKIYHKIVEIMKIVGNGPIWLAMS